MRRALVLALVTARFAVAHAQGATVSGVVRDTLTRTSLGGASVQLVSMDGDARAGHTAISDDAGRYQFTAIPDGRYRIGFFHPVLDSLGIEPVLREVVVANRRSVRMDLSTPSAVQLRAAVCGAQLPANDSSGFAMGVVRDIRRAPLADVAVTADWLEYVLRVGGLSTEPAVRRTNTRPNGWFVLCGLPRKGTVVLTASNGADTTDRVEAELVDGFLRRELYLGASRSIAVEDTMVVGDSVVRSRRIRRLGSGSLSGRIVASLDNSPIAGAQVTLLNGPQARTNANGEWSIADAPLGTRSVEYRAVGFYPDRTSIDVVAESAPIVTRLRTMKAVLDTVRIIETRANNREFAGFEQRQRSGAGHYVTMAEVERRNPLMISDLFRIMPGARLETIRGQPQVLVRGALTNWCIPNFYIDGLYVSQLNADEMNLLASPDEIAGIEVYSGTTVPAQFSNGLGSGGCGAIVIWTKMRRATRNAWTRRNVITTTSFIGISLLIGALLTRR